MWGTLGPALAPMCDVCCSGLRHVWMASPPAPAEEDRPMCGWWGGTPQAAPSMSQDHLWDWAGWGRSGPWRGHREAPPELEKKPCPCTLLPPETSWGSSPHLGFFMEDEPFFQSFSGKRWMGRCGPDLEAIGQAWQGAPQETTGWPFMRGEESRPCPPHPPVRGVGTSTTQQPAASSAATTPRTGPVPRATRPPKPMS